jgi:hypothetical protein
MSSYEVRVSAFVLRNIFEPFICIQCIKTHPIQRYAPSQFSLVLPPHTKVIPSATLSIVTFIAAAPAQIFYFLILIPTWLAIPWMVMMLYHSSEAIQRICSCSSVLLLGRLQSAFIHSTCSDFVMRNDAASVIQVSCSAYEFSANCVS